MDDYNLNHDSIRSALLKEAESYDPPAGLKQKIDVRLKQQEQTGITVIKKFRLRKAIAAAALACAMTGSICLAAGKISGYYSGTSSEFTKITDFSDISRLEKKAGVKTGAQKTLTNGFVFVDANIRDVDVTDAHGHVLKSFQDVAVCYEKDEKRVDYVVGGIQDMEPEDKFKQVIESDGVTYYFSQDNYLFVPDGYEPSPEEQKAQKAGKLFISTGTDVREERVVVGLSWYMDGQRYLLSGEDLDMNADELLAMAQQMNR